MMTLATESPRIVASARRAVEYLDDRAPLMEADASSSNPYVQRERPSLLAYNRPSWRTFALPAAPLAKTRYAASPQPQHPQQHPSPYDRDSHSRISMSSNTSTGDDDQHYHHTNNNTGAGRVSEDRMSWYTSDEESPLYTSSRRTPHQYPFHEGDEDEETKDNDHEVDHDDDDVDMLEAPRAADVPLLEIDEEEPEQEVDTILGDLTRLPRTTIIDEDGFLVDPRASLSHPAAAGEMGLGVTRPGMLIKSGLLFKQGFGFMNGGWKVRHVELTSAKLSFFKGEHGRKRGEIDLSTCSPKSIEIMPRDSVFDGAQATMWRFALKTKGRRVLLSAYSETDMKEWLRCLHVALAVQSSGAGRFTDLVVPNGTLLANKGDGLMRASGSGLR